MANINNEHDGYFVDDDDDEFEENARKLEEKSQRKIQGELSHQGKHKKEKILKPMKLAERQFVYSLPPWQRDSTPIATINCTSKSQEEWSRGLSPFYLGPVDLYKNYRAFNVENAWQFSKVYLEHLNKDGDPSDDWWQWAETGWKNPKAERFPMGRGAKPEYSYWNGKKYKYVDARYFDSVEVFTNTRIHIYAPIYAKLVDQSEAFKKLKQLYEQHKGNIRLWDFDGYDYYHCKMSLEDVLYDEKKKMGHAFVLLMLLKDEKYWENVNEKKLGGCARFQEAKPIDNANN